MIIDVEIEEMLKKVLEVRTHLYVLRYCCNLIAQISNKKK